MAVVETIKYILNN